MKVLIVCAAGFSSGLLIKRLDQYCHDNLPDASFKAVGIGGYYREFDGESSDQYDCVLVGPQVSFEADKIRKISRLPVAEIPSFDYASGNCPHIIQLAESLLSEAK